MMKFLRSGLMWMMLLPASGVFAQIQVDPSMPTDNDSIEVLFNAALGNAGLAGYTGDVYAHTGVITNQSSGGSDWKYVKADWGVNIPACKLTSLGNNLWLLKIGPSIRQYYGVPAGETILKMAFVFRSGVQVGGAWLEGKAAGGADIFWDVYPSGLTVNISSPSTDFVITTLNATTTVQVGASFADSVGLMMDQQVLTMIAGNNLTYPLTATSYGAHWIKAIAKNDTGMVADSFYYFVSQPVTIAEVPAGMKDGINYTSNSSLTLVLFAPLIQNVFVIGDMNNWLPDQAYFMKKTADGKRFWLEINGLTPGQEYIYQYLCDGSIRIGDPYAEKVSDPWSDSYIGPETYPGMLSYPFGKTTGTATVFQTAQVPYVWQTSSFTPPSNTDLIVYELLIRDFTEKHTFQSVIDTLSYLKGLGVNAIEFMPVSEFEGNISWGYNPDYYFAVDKYYGKADDFKKLVDACHENGIAVIMDIVLNHSFGSSPYVGLYWDKANNRPAANSPFYNPIAKHDFNVGYDMNHSTDETRLYCSNILKFWQEEYRVDGYRFDLSKGFTQNNTLGNTAAWGAYDASRITILKRYFDTIRSVNPDAILILEHFADNTEEKELANAGMLIWGNMNYNYRYANCGYTTGSNSDLSWGVYSNRGWTQPNLVTYMESHDEDRQMFYCINSGNSTGSYTIRDTITAINRLKLTGAFFFCLPGPKMIWQFGELGYDYSINWPSGTSASRLDPKPPRWDYLENFQRKHLRHYWSSLIKLRTEQAVFESTDFNGEYNGPLKKFRIRNNDMAVVVLGNFDIQSANIIPNFYTTGMWYDYLRGDSLNVTNVNAVVNLPPGGFRVYTSKKLETPIGLEESNADFPGLLLSPNPCNGQFSVFIPEGQGIQEMGLYDLNGRLIRTLESGRLDFPFYGQYSIDRSGVYILHYRTGKTQINRKLIVY